MKILIVSQSFYPDHFKINELIKDFAKAGHEVTVLSGLGDYTTGKVHPNYRFFRNRTEQYNGCTVKRVRTISRRTGPIFRSLNYLSFWFFGSIWAFFAAKKFDMVYVYQPSPATMIYPGITAAKRSQAPLLIYCLDIWPEAVKAMSIQEESLPFRMIHKLSTHAYQQASFILVSSQSFLTYMHEVNHIPYEKMAFLPQHAEDSLEIPKEIPISIQQAKHNFVFTGNIGYVQDIETIIKATALVPKDYDFRVHIVGDGSNLATCQQLAKELQLEEKVVFYGRQPSHLMPVFYDMADACLLTLKYENKIGLTIPAKLQGYMAAGKPVLAAIEGDAKQVIKEADCGLCVAASDEQGLADGLVQFMAYSPQELKQMGENAKTYVAAHFTKDTFVTKTLETMKKLVRKKGSHD